MSHALLQSYKINVFAFIKKALWWHFINRCQETNIIIIQKLKVKSLNILIFRRFRFYLIVVQCISTLVHLLNPKELTKCHCRFIYTRIHHKTACLHLGTQHICNSYFYGYFIDYFVEKMVMDIFRKWHFHLSTYM